MAEEPAIGRMARNPAFVSVLALGFIGTMGTNVLSPALPAIASGLEVSDSEVGLVLSTFKLTAVIVIPVTTLLADLYGRRPVVIPSLVVFGLAGVAMSTVDSFATLLALCAVLGLGFAGFMPLSIAMVGDLYTGARGSAAQGVRSAVNGLGSVVLPAATGFLAGFAWNRPFWLFFGVFPVVVLAWAFLPELDRSGRETTDLETGLGRRLRTYATAVRAELRRPEMRLLFGGGFTRDFIRYGVITFVPLFAVRGLGASLFAAGLVLSVRGVTSIAVSPTLGYVVSATSRKTVLVASFATAALGVAAIPFSPDVVWLGVAFGCYSVGDALASPIVKDTVTDAASSTHRAGIVGGLMVVKNGGQALAPATFGGILAITSMGGMFLVAAGLAAAYGVVVLARLDPSV